MAAHGGQVGDLLVGDLADQTATLEVLHDAVEQARVLQERERFEALFFAENHLGLCGRQRFLHLFIAQLFELAKQAADVLADHVFLDVQLLGGALDEDDALAVGVQVERVDVEVVAPRHQEVRAHDPVRRVFPEPASAVAAVFAFERDLVAVDGHLRLGG